MRKLSGPGRSESARAHGVAGRTAAVALLVALVGALVPAFAATPAAADACGANAIVCENALPGTPRSQWDVGNDGDASIQGFATQMSVNVGDTVHFKVKTDASAYTVKIFRFGYYQGLGARLVDTVSPSATLPQTQPPCLTDASGLVDCGNWAESASWAVPSDRGLGRVRGAPHPHRHPHRQRDHVRRPRRREPLRRPVPDVGRDLAGVQHLRRQQPLHRDERGLRRRRAQGELQPTAPRPHQRSRQQQLLRRRDPDGPLPRAQRLRRQLLQQRRHQQPRLVDPEPQDVHLVGSRRVLVGRDAHQRAGRTRRRRESLVLLGQLDLLEDPLRALDRRHERRRPHGRLLQGDPHQPRTRGRRPDR